eukprot:TRINITY_DN3782_c0_g1_i1.p1 TRINITY_DN3782_c0_g1~~TRINITY_DN3782_c0_g1_i1.p1  ORF type:complete len:440 (-),score=93.50 TRINITY_DN3782_c0_g1_i1:471-1790(-)
MTDAEKITSSFMTIAMSAIVGVLSIVLFLAFYLKQKRNEIKTVAQLPSETTTSKQSKSVTKSTNVKKLHADKAQARKQHHSLDLNTLKGHTDAVNWLCFSSDGKSLATACADRVVRVFKLDNISSKSFQFLRINIPSGNHPVAVAFCKDASKIIVGNQKFSSSSLCMYEVATHKPSKDSNQQSKLPAPEIKWEHNNIHRNKAIITLFGTSATYGTADGSTVLVSSSEGTDIKVCQGENGRLLGELDTNQLKNHTAVISPNGRFVAAAAFTADVKVWEIVYQKDGSVKETPKAMQLKGHTSAVTWLSFTSDSERILTASKDGTLRIWNINVRYHLDEDPKCLKVFQIPLHDEKGSVSHYDRLCISPDDKIIAASNHALLQWLNFESGEVLDTADKVHEGDITCMAWSPQPVSTEYGVSFILATSSTDKRVKLWAAPKLPK